MLASISFSFISYLEYKSPTSESQAVLHGDRMSEWFRRALSHTVVNDDDDTKTLVAELVTDMGSRGELK